MSEFVPLAGRIVDALLLADPDRGDRRRPPARRGTARLLARWGHGAARRCCATRATHCRKWTSTRCRPPSGSITSCSARWWRRSCSTSPSSHVQLESVAAQPGRAAARAIARPFAPVADRLESLAGRLRPIPDALATARTVLRDCPRIHLETAAQQFGGAASLVRDEVPRMLVDEPALRGTDTAAADGGRRRPRGVRRVVRRASRAGRDPRLGRRLWEAKLWHTLETELPAAEVLGTRRRSSTGRRPSQLRELSRPDVRRHSRGRSTRLADEHPDNDTIIGLAKETLEETTVSSPSTTW